MKRWIAAVIVVGLLALSGCSLLESGSETPEPLPVGEPSWMGDDGSVDEAALVQAHFDATSNSTVAIDESLYNFVETRAVFSPAGNYSQSDGFESWAEGRLDLTRDTENGTSYDVEYLSFRNTSSETRLGNLEAILQTGEYEVTGTVRHDGRRVYELSIVEPSGAGYAEGRALVDPSGRIHALSGRHGMTADAARTYEYDIDWSAEPVSEPAWTSRVPHVEGRRTTGNETAALTVTEGPAIPAGTSFQVTLRSHERPIPSVDGTVTLDRPLQSGETLYLGIDTGGENRTLRAGRSPLSGPLQPLRQGLLETEGTRIDGEDVSIRVSVGQPLGS